MKGGVKGVFYNKVSMKYDVRLNRQNITYTVGKFETYEEAVQARAAFLMAYNMNPPEPVIEPYSKKWWAMKAEEQREKFRSVSE